MPPFQPFGIRLRRLGEVHRAPEHVEHAPVLMHPALRDEARVETFRILAPELGHLPDPQLAQILCQARPHAGNGLEIVAFAVRTPGGHWEVAFGEPSSRSARVRPLRSAFWTYMGHTLAKGMAKILWPDNGVAPRCGSRTIQPSCARMQRNASAASYRIARPRHASVPERAEAHPQVLLTPLVAGLYSTYADQLNIHDRLTGCGTGLMKGGRK